MDECLEEMICEEFALISEEIINNNLFDIKTNTDTDHKLDMVDNLQYVFGLLQKDTFELFQDLHLVKLQKSFDRSLLTFVDMGVALFNQDAGQKYYFIKMVHSNK